MITTANISIIPSELAGIFSVSDEKTIDISISGVSNGVDNITVMLDCKDAWGIPVKLFPDTITLNRSKGFTERISSPSIPGYYELSYGIKGDTDTGHMSIAIIPDVKVETKDFESPFGVNTHFNQGWDQAIGKIVSKVGIAWIRDGEATLDDRALPVANENNLCYLPCFTWYHAPDEKDRNADGTWDFSEIADRHKKYAEKYGSDIDFYDLVNEPHGPWSAVIGGSWNGGDWQKVFVQFGRAVTNAIKAGDPGAKVVWEDIDQLLWYKQFHALGVSSEIDIISPHPYNLNRSIPLPEQQTTLSQVNEFNEFTRLNRLPWTLWSGEVGYSSFQVTDQTPTSFYSPNTELQQAQKLVRMMVMYLLRGFQKIFWYDFKNDGVSPDDPEHNFGLINHDYSPKPSVVAYANLIHRLKGCRWFGSYAIGGSGNAYAYISAASNPTLVAWKQNGSSSEVLLVESDVLSVTVTDMFGKSKEVVVDNHQILLDLDESPVYVDGLLLSDILPFITGR
ncbi:MAG: hypothetical protein ACYC27_03900 [Armatimonadota bacterium]